MNFKPLGQRILVERMQEASKTSSGIIIPDNAKEKPLNAKVVAISKEVEEEGIVKVNSVVVFAKYSGTDLTLEGSEYLVLNIDDVLGVLQ